MQAPCRRAVSRNESDAIASARFAAGFRLPIGGRVPCRTSDPPDARPSGCRDRWTRLRRPRDPWADAPPSEALRLRVHSRAGHCGDEGTVARRGRVALPRSSGLAAAGGAACCSRDRPRLVRRPRQGSFRRRLDRQVEPLARGDAPTTARAAAFRVAATLCGAGRGQGSTQRSSQLDGHGMAMDGVAHLVDRLRRRCEPGASGACRSPGRGRRHHAGNAGPTPCLGRPRT